MKLIKIQVTNFRSVYDSEEFEVDPVTCLVGKNEAGKSAILLALAALNPNRATPVTLDKERDYPRRNLVRYEQIHGKEDAVVVRTIWQLDESDIQVIAEDVGKDVLTCRLVEVSRCYGRDIEVSAKLNYSAAVRHDLQLFALNAVRTLDAEVARDHRSTHRSAQRSLVSHGKARAVERIPG